MHVISSVYANCRKLCSSWLTFVIKSLMMCRRRWCSKQHSMLYLISCKAGWHATINEPNEGKSNADPHVFVISSMVEWFVGPSCCELDCQIHNCSVALKCSSYRQEYQGGDEYSLAFLLILDGICLAVPIVFVNAKAHKGHDNASICQFQSWRQWVQRWSIPLIKQCITMPRYFPMDCWCHINCYCL